MKKITYICKSCGRMFKCKKDGEERTCKPNCPKSSGQNICSEDLGGIARSLMCDNCDFWDGKGIA